MNSEIKMNIYLVKIGNGNSIAGIGSCFLYFFNLYLKTLKKELKDKMRLKLDLKQAYHSKSRFVDRWSLIVRVCGRLTGIKPEIDHVEFTSVS